MSWFIRKASSMSLVVVRRIAFMAAIYWIWVERNALTFQNVNSDIQRVVHKICYSVKMWVLLNPNFAYTDRIKPVMLDPDLLRPGWVLAIPVTHRPRLTWIFFFKKNNITDWEVETHVQLQIQPSLELVVQLQLRRPSSLVRRPPM